MNKIFPLTFIFLPFSVLAESFVGQIRLVGSSFNSYVVLTSQGQTEKKLCPGNLTKKMRKLSGMTVEAEGQMVENKKSYLSCFETSSFKVKRVRSGRPALVGELKKKGDQFVVNTPDGKAHELRKIPEGLKSLEGKQVIIDVKPHGGTVAQPTGKWRVVTYSEFP